MLNQQMQDFLDLFFNNFFKTSQNVHSENINFFIQISPDVKIFKK
jgi:hypothetical protein